MITPVTALALVLSASLQAPAAEPVQTEALAQDALASGQIDKAIDALEARLKADPDDPALLINLGIAQARAGDEQAAKAAFERALVSPEPVALETADGNAIDSRRLARKAIRMLEAGEFATQLTRRD